MKTLEEIKLKRKWKIHVIHNSHTDLGYTHRQEYLYRAHSKYIERVIDIIENDKDYKWTVEVYWMVENFKKRSTKKYIEKFDEYVKSGNIEITTNYLNVLNICDFENIKSKGDEIRNAYPVAKSALQQDVNSYSRSQAIALFETGTENLYASIHTHHGMFAGDGKQRGFVWDLGEGRKINVWAGEHYQLGNEMFLHQMNNHKYTFKDDIENYSNDGFKQGVIRLKHYLKLLEEEEYPGNIVPVCASGILIDNAAPNANVSKGVKAMNSYFGEDVEIELSTLTEFFNEVDMSSMPTYSGEWTSWWVDGSISTPEEVRLYRESQKIYKIISEWNKENKKINQDKIKELESAMLMFSEHTWGSWSSQSNPFSNGNNLLLARKRAMANKASALAWELLDEIRETEGYEIVKLKNTNTYTLVNPFNETIDKLITLPKPDFSASEMFTDRYILFEDMVEVVDEENNVMPSAISKLMGGYENINTNLDGDTTLMVRVTLKPHERKLITARIKDDTYAAMTSSYRRVGVENEDDIEIEQPSSECVYNRNGIENAFYKITWNENGIKSIYDKEIKKELLIPNRFIRPIHVVSPGDSRREMGRNRQGPSASVTRGTLYSHKREINRSKIQVTSLFYKVEGTKLFKINISLTSLEKNIRFETFIQKTNDFDSENIYLDFPFAKQDTIIHNESGYFKLWKDQLPNTNIDYVACDNGFITTSQGYEVALSSPDCPLVQTGSLEFKRRSLMKEGLDATKAETMIWLMTNYWETNYKGSLEGNYKFNFELSSGKLMKKWLNDKSKQAIGFANYKKEI